MARWYRRPPPSPSVCCARVRLASAMAAGRGMRFGGLARSCSQVRLAHRHAFAIRADTNTWLVSCASWSVAQRRVSETPQSPVPHAPRVAPLGASARAPRRPRERRHDVIKRVLRGLHRHAPPHTMRVTLRRQVQRRIQGTQASPPGPPSPIRVISTSPKIVIRRRVCARWWESASLSIEDGLGDGPGTSLIHVGWE